jgi:hypothetical protein
MYKRQSQQNLRKPFANLVLLKPLTSSFCGSNPCAQIAPIRKFQSEAEIVTIHKIIIITNDEWMPKLSQNVYFSESILSLFISKNCDIDSFYHNSSSGALINRFECLAVRSFTDLFHNNVFVHLSNVKFFDRAAAFTGVSVS